MVQDVKQKEDVVVVTTDLNLMELMIKNYTCLYYTGKTLCNYETVFAPYLHDWTLYGINTVQKWVRIYMAFFLC